jgi:hypothetical protein
MPKNNIVSAATLRYEEAVIRLAEEANAIVQESLDYSPKITSLGQKIDTLKPKIEPFAWAPEWVPVGGELDAARKENAAAQVPRPTLARFPVVCRRLGPPLSRLPSHPHSTRSPLPMLQIRCSFVRSACSKDACGRACGPVSAGEARGAYAEAEGARNPTR